MTYAAGQNILASDFNGLAGVPSGDASPQANKVGSVYGIGYGDRGYGQTVYTWTAKAASQDIGSAEWTAMRNALSVCASHQGTAVATLPPTSVLDPLDTIFAETNPPRPYEFPTHVASIDTNRLNTNGGLSMTLTASALTITRGSTWGAGATGIQCEFDVDFGTEDQARYFFNSGGAVSFVLAHPDVSNAKNMFWNGALADIGTIQFRAHDTTRSGFRATPQAVGYYELTTSYQMILDGTNINAGGGYYYSVNDVLVEARSTSITGLRDAKGSVVRFRVTLTDEALTGDPVAAGTNVVAGHLRATAVLSGIVTPTLSTVTPF